MTEHDPLTGLANRRQLSEALEQQWLLCPTSSTTVKHHDDRYRFF